MQVGHRLRFHALPRVHDEQRAFAGVEAARDLVGEIHVSRRVNQVENVVLPVVAAVTHRYRVHLDRDAALPLQVHGVQVLFFQIAVGDRRGRLQQAVAQRGLAVIHVGNNAKVTYFRCIHEKSRKTIASSSNATQEVFCANGARLSGS